MRFIKGKSPRKKLIFENFRAAAPILGFFGHNPKLSRGGAFDPPPLCSRPIWPEGGGRILLSILIVPNMKLNMIYMFVD